MELYNPTSLTSELIHKTEPWRWNTTCFRSSAWPKSPSFWVASRERGASGVLAASEIARKRRGDGGGFLGLGLAIFCLFLNQNSRGSFSKITCQSGFFVELNFLFGEKKMSIRYTPPQSNMSPKKGPFQKERIVFQPLFFRGEPLVLGGVFFSLVPEWIREWLAYLRGRLIYNSPKSYIQEMERIH